MSSKEVKARLKAAKAAVDKKDFQEVQKCCQVGVLKQYESVQNI